MFACRNYRPCFVYLFWEKTKNIVHLWEAIEQNAITCYIKKSKIQKTKTWWVDIYWTQILIILDIYISYRTKPVLDRVGEVNVCMGPHHVCFDGEEYLLAYAKNVSPISHTELLIFYKLDKHTSHSKSDNMILLR